MIMNNDTSNSQRDHFQWKRKTAFFLTGQMISLFGSSVVQYSIIWYITLSTSSGLMMTIASICGFLPQLLISLFAGVWADRYNRKILIMVTDSLIALSTLTLALLFLAGYKQIWLLFLISGIRSFFLGIQTPAINAFIPQMVPSEHLMRVNGINGGMQSLILIISPVVSGAMLSMVSLQATFFVDVATAIVAVGIMFALKVPPHQRALEKQTTSVFTDLKEGLHYLYNHPFIKAVLIFYGIFMFLITPCMFLTPLMIARSYGKDVWLLSANEIAFSIGAILGGVLMSSWGGYKNKIYTIALASIGFGVFTVFLGLSPTFWLYLIFMVIHGVFMPLSTSSCTVLLQEKVRESMQGRIFSFYQILTTAAMPLGMIVFGPMSDWISVESIFIITGIFTVALSVSIIFNKHICRGL